MRHVGSVVRDVLAMTAARASGGEGETTSISKVNYRARDVFAELQSNTAMAFRDHGCNDDFIKNKLTERANLFYDIAAEVCESPIEQIMLAALMSTSPKGFEAVVPTVYDLTSGKELPASDLIVIPQFPFGAFRFDFFLMAEVAGRTDWIAIECDGHHYHKATTQQVCRDERRDLISERLNVRTLRYSGSQIHRWGAMCADEISCVLEQAKRRTSERGQKAVA